MTRPGTKLYPVFLSRSRTSKQGTHDALFNVSTTLSSKLRTLFSEHCKCNNSKHPKNTDHGQPVPPFVIGVDIVLNQYSITIFRCQRGWLPLAVFKLIHVGQTRRILEKAEPLCPSVKEQNMSQSGSAAHFSQTRKQIIANAPYPVWNEIGGDEDARKVKLRH